MNILHATTDPNLLTRLKQMLSSAHQVDIAVGYFFVSGFDAVADELSKLSKTRILVGRTDRQTLEAVALGLQQADALKSRLDIDSIVQRRNRERVAQNAVDNIVSGVTSLPQTNDSQKAVTRLRDMIAAGFLEVRAYPNSLLHAKAYLCWYDGHAEKGSAIVGSSNFTLAGFTGNTELNVRVTGDAEMDELSRWFEELWGKSVDISEAVAAELERSWAIAHTPPYHVYLKALHELYGDSVAEDSELPLSDSPVALTNFQLDAVRWGLSTIDKHGGCYIGDVVGLGKTFIGAELLRQLRQSYNRDGDPLIICPAGLVGMWRQVNEVFQLGAEVISQHMIAPPPSLEFDEELGRYMDADPTGRGVVLADVYRGRGPVLVDEAHNFRNINRRTRGLQHYLESGDHKVILLSATPQNLGPRDIYRQLRLFLDEIDHGLNIDPIGLEDYFRVAERWHEHRIEYDNFREEYGEWERGGGKKTPPDPPKEPDAPRAEIEQVLAPVFIRRRRKDLRELYGNTVTVNDEPVSFPDPVLDNIEYRLDRVYAKAGPFDELRDLMKDHTAARYRAVDYLEPGALSKPEYRDLLRAKNRIAGLMRALLSKRLESSVAAFRSTLSTLITSNRNFREALEAGYVPIGQAATRMLAGSSFDADELLESLEQEEDRRRQLGGSNDKLVHSTNDFKLTEWLDALDIDHGKLTNIRDRVSGIRPEDDDKLQTLKGFLNRPDVKRGKVLIFSESETTIEYLYQNLNPNDENPEMARLSGSNRDNLDSIVHRFSPKSNPRDSGQRRIREIKVLLATDVVSEGQNLQDCGRVVNYDLHWNPVRMIQRFGRIDRIGTEHSVIHLNNMWPDLAVDQDLSLTEKLGRRIQMFHDLIGLDSRLLSENERINDDAMYSIYEKREMPELDDALDELAAYQRSQTLLQRIQRDDPKLWEIMTRLPDGIRSSLMVGRPSAHADNDQFIQMPMATEGAQMPMVGGVEPSSFDSPQPGETLVLLGTGEVRSCYAVGSDLPPRPITPAQFVAAAECEPDTPAEDLPPDTNKRVMAAFDMFQRDVSRRLGRARPTNDSRNRRYIGRQLNLAQEEVEPGSQESRNIEALRLILRGGVSATVENHLTEIRNLQLTGPALLTRLNALRQRYRLNPPEDTGQMPAAPQVIRIVCSDGLTD